MAIFAKDIPPVTVKEEGDAEHVYRAGAITVIAASAAYRDADDVLGSYIRNHYGFDQETGEWRDDLPREERIERDVLRFHPEAYLKAQVVIAASTQELEAPAVLDWIFNSEKFFEDCYQAAIKLNPNLALVKDQEELSPNDEEDSNSKK
jgi:hypothetical protein